MTPDINKQPQAPGWRLLASPVASLFASAATLVCCALPALMVTLGLGAVLAGMVSAFPPLVWLSQHKPAVFGGALFMLTMAGVLLWRARHLPCPADPRQARACARLRRFSVAVYAVSGILFLTGAFFAFVAPLVLQK